MKFYFLAALSLAAGVASAQVGNFLSATQIAWGVGDNLPAPYTQVDMNVAIEVRVGFFWIPYAQNVGVTELLIPKTAGSANFNVPLNAINPIFNSNQPINLVGTTVGNQVTWAISQTFTQAGGYQIVTQFDNNGTPVDVNVNVNNVLTTGTLRSLYATLPPAVIATLQDAADTRGTYTGGDAVNFIDMTAGTASGTVGGVSINGVRLRFRNIQHINHPPMDLKVTGTITRQDIAAPAAFTGTAELRTSPGGVLAHSGPISVAASGAYTYKPASVLPGSYTLSIKSGSFLKKSQTVTLSSSTVANFTLQNGDVDGSGEVDAADIDGVIAAFGGSTNGPTIWPDVDFSGEVDAADIDIVIANFGGTDN